MKHRTGFSGLLVLGFSFLSLLAIPGLLASCSKKPTVVAKSADSTGLLQMAADNLTSSLTYTVAQGNLPPEIKYNLLTAKNVSVPGVAEAFTLFHAPGEKYSILVAGSFKAAKEIRLGATYLQSPPGEELADTPVDRMYFGVCRQCQSTDGSKLTTGALNTTVAASARPASSDEEDERWNACVKRNPATGDSYGRTCAAKCKKCALDEKKSPVCVDFEPPLKRTKTGYCTPCELTEVVCSGIGSNGGNYVCCATDSSCGYTGTFPDWNPKCCPERRKCLPGYTEGPDSKWENGCAQPVCTKVDKKCDDPNAQECWGTTRGKDDELACCAPTDSCGIIRDRLFDPGGPKCCPAPQECPHGILRELRVDDCPKRWCNPPPPPEPPAPPKPPEPPAPPKPTEPPAPPKPTEPPAPPEPTEPPAPPEPTEPPAPPEPTPPPRNTCPDLNGRIYQTGPYAGMCRIGCQAVEGSSPPECTCNRVPAKPDGTCELSRQGPGGTGDGPTECKNPSAPISSCHPCCFDTHRCINSGFNTPFSCEPK